MGGWLVCAFARSLRSLIHSFSMSQKKTTWNESKKRKFCVL